MNITKGKIVQAQRALIYGPEGIGKSLLASHFPDPLFFDVEDGTADLDVARTDRPASWEMLGKQLLDFKNDPKGYKTAVIDTADWAERLDIENICAANSLSSLGGQADYGKSYNLLESSWGKFLDFLSEIAANGIHVVLVAHSHVRTFNVLEEGSGGYDRWELKLQKKTAALTKEWARLILFANYKTMVVDIDGKKKGVGGKRVMYTTHHSCWDAKNRVGLKDELPLEFSAIEHLFNSTTIPPVAPAPPPIAPASPPLPPDPPTIQAPLTAAPPEESLAGIPEQLIQLMKADNVSVLDIQQAVAANGYYPLKTPITKYTKEFIIGKLVGSWPKVLEKISIMKGATA